MAEVCRVKIIDYLNISTINWCLGVSHGTNRVPKGRIWLATGFWRYFPRVGNTFTDGNVIDDFWTPLSFRSAPFFLSLHPPPCVTLSALRMHIVEEMYVLLIEFGSYFLSCMRSHYVWFWKQCTFLWGRISCISITSSPQLRKPHSLGVPLVQFTSFWNVRTLAQRTSRSRAWRILASSYQYRAVITTTHWRYVSNFPFNPLAESLMWLNRPDENLNTPQRHQHQTRTAFRQLNVNVDESPRCCRTPAPRPETPTPQPGAVERARMNSCQSRHETRNNLQDSPRRWHLRNTENANHALSPPEREASARSVFLGNKVRIINFFCVTEVSSYRLFRPPLLLFWITYHYQALLQCKWSLAPIIKLSPHGNRCNYLKARDLRVWK